MGFLSAIMDTFFGNKDKKFIAEHKLPADQEQFLVTGAILAYANQHPPQVLAAKPDGNAPAAILETMGIYNADDLRERLKWLLEEGGDGAQLEAAFKAYKKGDAKAIAKAQDRMYRYVLDDIMDGTPMYGQLKEMSRAFAEKVDTMSAWDIERAAFWARMGFNAGYLTQEETFGLLGQTRALARERFANWPEYLVSFMAGRALVMCEKEHKESMDDIFSNGCLLEDLKWGAVWALYPLKR